MAEAAAQGVCEEDQGYGAQAAWGGVPLPSSATMAAQRDIGCRTEDRQQKYSEDSGQTLQSCTSKSGNPKRPIALETGGKEIARGFTTYLAWRQVHAHAEAFSGSGGPNRV